MYGKCTAMFVYVMHFVAVGTGNTLLMENISRHCADAYECVASNDIPPSINRRIHVAVECKNIVSV